MRVLYPSTPANDAYTVTASAPGYLSAEFTGVEHSGHRAPEHPHPLKPFHWDATRKALEPLNHGFPVIEDLAGAL